MIADCTALILAGGGSTRMGQDKALLDLGGETLLQRVTATMQSLFPKTIVSVRQTRVEVDLPQVRDTQPDGGPLAGLVAGLAEVDTPWIFAVACDMPFVMVDVVEQLAAYRTAPLLPASPRQGRRIDSLTVKGGLGRGGVQAVVPIIGGYPQPLAAFYATSALGTMRASLASEDRSLRGVLRRLNVREVSETELRAFDPQLRSFFDLDTPQDLAAAREK